MYAKFLRITGGNLHPLIKRVIGSSNILNFGIIALFLKTRCGRCPLEPVLGSINERRISLLLFFLVLDKKNSELFSALLFGHRWCEDAERAGDQEQQSDQEWG
jgi:hypothetical protein